MLLDWYHKLVRLVPSAVIRFGFGGKLFTVAGCLVRLFIPLTTGSEIDTSGSSMQKI